VKELAQESGASALDAALGRVGDRWSFLVVEALLDGPRRFSELVETLPGIAPNILTDRLRRLEREGVLVGRKYSERPARLAYSLTADGLELAGVLRLLAAWGAGPSGAEGLRHVTCGSLLEAHWFCPTCARTVDEREESSALRFA
jgi:DNA-binding HxlR family transcriptional regulator